MNTRKNNDLRIRIAEMVYNSKEGHIPSAYSIIDILSALYDKILKYDSKNPEWAERDYFILSKGHGCKALYVILEKYGFITKEDIFRKEKIILGGHPDCTKVPGVEASTGSLGHGVVTAMGIALGLKIKKKANKVIALIGDGENNEGTVWETALIAQNLKLGNLCVVVDNNESLAQILKYHDLNKMWDSFGWNVYEINGHDEEELISTFNKISFNYNFPPSVIIANTVKGKGVDFIEGHGHWHHKIPTIKELETIMRRLS